MNLPLPLIEPKTISENLGNFAKHLGYKVLTIGYDDKDTFVLYLQEPPEEGIANLPTTFFGYNLKTRVVGNVEVTV